MSYRPRLPNGQLAPLSLPLLAYGWLNQICWPIRDGASNMLRFMDRFIWLLGFIVFMQHNDAELRYIIMNHNSLDIMLICGPTYLILLEVLLRGFQLGLHKERFKRFLQKFYAEIYIEKTSHPNVYAAIQKTLRPIWLLSLLYYTTLASYIISSIVNYINGITGPLYKMIYPFDITPIPIYTTIILSNIWVGTMVVSYIVGENNILSEVMVHLNGRFLLLQHELRQNTLNLLRQVDHKNVADDFSNLIVEAIKENVRLYEFAKCFEREFSFRIFFNLSFSAFLLCVLGFKVYTNPISSIGFVFWICAKVMEMLLMGHLGSALMATTNQMSYSFYESNWELIIEKSGNSNVNIRLMKILLLAIGTSQRPFVLRGFKYFSVSLTAVVKLLRVAASYFTFLTTIRQ